LRASPCGKERHEQSTSARSKARSEREIMCRFTDANAHGDADRENTTSPRLRTHYGTVPPRSLARIE
jgi:hypothetical protein